MNGDLKRTSKVPLGEELRLFSIHDRIEERVEENVSGNRIRSSKRTNSLT